MTPDDATPSAASLASDAGDAGDRRTALIVRQLREANERLILAALHAQLDSEASADRLRRVQRSADHDGLTGLPTRRLLHDRFELAAAIAARHHTRLAILFLDLNDFKAINDTMGHLAGDQVLRHTATVLTTAVRASDTVSRHGGDEFVVLLTDVGSRDAVIPLAEKLLAALGAPMTLDDHVVLLAASIGISLYPDDGVEIDALMALADAAMYRSKKGAPARYAFHGDPVDAESQLPRPASAGRPLAIADTDSVSDRQGRETALMRTANEQLILATLDARSVHDELEAANARQRSFMAVLAHDLRNPLAPMRNVSALLAQVKPGDPILPRLQDIIERQIVHMARMIDDLMDVSRAQTGSVTLALRETDLITVVNDAIAACEPAMVLRQQRLASILPGAPCPVIGDPIRLTQIFTNLLSNASSYTAARTDLTLHVTADAAHVIIALWVGETSQIPEESQASFEKFLTALTHGQSSAARRGIGLAVINELIAAHGGTLEMGTHPSHTGSRLIVTLPVGHTTRVS